MILRSSFLSCISLLGLFTILTSCGETAARESDVSVFGGVITKTNDFALNYYDVGISAYCTMSRIGERVFLTAGHCLFKADGQQLPLSKRSIQIYDEVGKSVSGTTTLFGDFRIYNSCDGKSSTCSGNKYSGHDPWKVDSKDLAVVYLRPKIDPVTMQDSVAKLLPVSGFPIIKKFEVPKDVTKIQNIGLTGYGCRGGKMDLSGKFIPDDPYSLRQWASIKTSLTLPFSGLGSTTSSSHAFWSVPTSYTLDANRKIVPALGGQVCPGDSGGPVSYEDSSGNPVLVGVNSGYMVTDSPKYLGSQFAKLDVAWIQDRIQAPHVDYLKVTSLPRGKQVVMFGYNLAGSTVVFKQGVVTKTAKIQACTPTNPTSWAPHGCFIVPADLAKTIVYNTVLVSVEKVSSSGSTLSDKILAPLPVF